MNTPTQLTAYTRKRIHFDLRNVLQSNVNMMAKKKKEKKLCVPFCEQNKNKINETKCTRKSYKCERQTEESKIVPKQHK